jgi:hypothetical protein
MLHRVTLVRTDVSEEHITSIIKVKRVDELGTALAANSNQLYNVSSQRASVAGYS